MARPKGHILNRDAFDEWRTKHLGQSVASVADSANLPRQTLAGIAAGTQAASITSAHAIAKAMGCKVGLLFPTLSRDAESMVAV